MLSWKRVVPFVVFAFLAAPLFAAEEKAEEKPAAPAASADQIAALVKQLDSDKFQQRQDASEALAKIGKPAIEAVGQAATGDSLEVTVRSIDLLKGFLKSSDQPTKDAAKAALEKIAKCERPSAARRAQDVLKTLEQQQQQRGNGVVPGGIQIRAVAGAAGRRISVRTVNGVKTIEVDEGNQKIKIVDDPKNGIKMEVTESKNGKQTTEKYEAKNAEELKKKNAKAYEIYKKYSQQGGNVIVQMQVGGPIRIARPVPAVRPQPLGKIDLATRMISSWGAALKRYATDEEIKNASDKSRKQLKEKIADMKKDLADLEKRLDQAIEKAEKEAEKTEDKPESPAEGQ